MKVKVNNPKPTFEPIELYITIESEEELCDLHHRLSTEACYINKDSGSSLKHEAEDNVTYELYHALDELVEQLDLNQPYPPEQRTGL